MIFSFRLHRKIRSIVYYENKIFCYIRSMNGISINRKIRRSWLTIRSINSNRANMIDNRWFWFSYKTHRTDLNERKPIENLRLIFALWNNMDLIVDKKEYILERSRRIEFEIIQIFLLELILLDRDWFEFYQNHSMKCWDIVIRMNLSIEEMLVHPK